jgi:hypothetical protein
LRRPLIVADAWKTKGPGSLPRQAEAPLTEPHGEGGWGLRSRSKQKTTLAGIIRFQSHQNKKSPGCFLSFARGSLLRRPLGPRSRFARTPNSSQHQFVPRPLKQKAPRSESRGANRINPRNAGSFRLCRSGVNRAALKTKGPDIARRGQLRGIMKCAGQSPLPSTAASCRLHRVKIGANEGGGG